jgi:hypothetical protein
VSRDNNSIDIEYVLRVPVMRNQNVYIENEDWEARVITQAPGETI